MLLNISGEKIETNVLNDSISDFGIANNTNLFRILSDKIYTNKIGAVIRELSCNAYDSHVMANKKDVPFEIHLPNTLEPFFSVKDFGVGLSDEDIKKVFIWYGVSTKTTTNDAIGAFGLGAKSPFAYTSSFSIISNFNGIKTTYSAFADECGKMKLAAFNKIECLDESNGIEIIVPVEMSDFNEFKEQVNNILYRFDPLPIIKGAEFEFNIDKKTILIGNDKWKVYNKSHTDRFNKSYAVMGNIGYVLDEHAIPQIAESKKLLLFFKYYNIELYYNIGDIDISVSREEISYDRKTTETIYNSIIELYNNFDGYIEDLITGSGDIIKARKEFIKLDEYSSPLHKMNYFNNRSIKLNGFEICSKHIELNGENLLLKDFNIFQYNVKRVYNYKIEEYDVSLSLNNELPLLYSDERKNELTNKYRWYYRCSDSYIKYSDIFNKLIYFIVIDEDISDRKVKNKIKNYIKENNINTSSSIYVFKKLEESSIQDFAKEISEYLFNLSGLGIDLIKSSSLKEKPKNKTKYNPNKRLLDNIYSYNKRVTSYNDFMSVDEKVLELDQAYYFIFNKTNDIKLTINGQVKSKSLYTFLDNISFYKNLIGETPLFAIHSNAEKSIKKFKNFIDISETIEKKLKEIFSNNKVCLTTSNFSSHAYTKKADENISNSILINPFFYYIIYKSSSYHDVDSLLKSICKYILDSYDESYLDCRLKDLVNDPENYNLSPSYVNGSHLNEYHLYGMFRNEVYTLNPSFEYKETSLDMFNLIVELSIKYPQLKYIKYNASKDFIDFILKTILIKE